MSEHASNVPHARHHVVTAQEALEPLYVKLEVEAEMRLIKAAVDAGWSAEEAAAAISELRRQDVMPATH